MLSTAVLMAATRAKHRRERAKHETASHACARAEQERELSMTESEA